MSHTLNFTRAAAGAILLLSLGTQGFARERMPADFCPLRSVDSSIAQDIRLAGRHNFVGRPIAGYSAPKCILTRKTAQALATVQADLRLQGLSLKVFDCYRPAAAVKDLLNWGKDPGDTRMKKEFYPNIAKADIFHGYISPKSSHSRGSAVDVTIKDLDMGTSYDYFDPLSNTANPGIAPVQMHNRMKLKILMEKHGFKNLNSEWWHYSLENEPHPNEYFDFEIR